MVTIKHDDFDESIAVIKAPSILERRCTDKIIKMVKNIIVFISKKVDLPGSQSCAQHWRVLRVEIAGTNSRNDVYKIKTLTMSSGSD